ncbi:MAG: ABC transporter permease subunit [Rhodospirillaceae bacterium]|nr:ABC transporter permease subunit [Rhodospirillaceae bacterium]
MTAPDYKKEKIATGRMARMIAVFKKEMRDHLRDRRTLLLALIYPLLAPALVAGGLYIAGTTIQSERTAVAFNVVVVGGANSPMLTSHLEKNEITIIEMPSAEEAKKQMLEGDMPVGLVIPIEAKNEKEFSVQMLMNLSRVSNLRLTARLENVINQLNAELGKQELNRAGLKEDFARPIKIEDISITRRPNIATFFYNMMPPLIIFMVFLGGVHLAIDTTVGERERGSLEPLLLSPVERWILLLAKSSAAMVFTAITSFINIIAFYAFCWWAVSYSENLAHPPAWYMFILMFVISLPLMAIAVALQMSIAVITRSMKEAQIYLGLLPLVPALPGMIMVFKPLSPGNLDVAIPVFGQLLLLGRLSIGEPVYAMQVLTASASTFIAAGAIFWLAARWFKREKMFLLG